jgi:uncharacterized membrane protein
VKKANYEEIAIAEVARIPGLAVSIVLLCVLRVGMVVSSAASMVWNWAFDKVYDLAMRLGG